MTEPQSPAVRKCSECDKLFQDWRKLGHCDDCDRKMLRERKFDETLKANFGVSIFGEEEDYLANS